MSGNEVIAYIRDQTGKNNAVSRGSLFAWLDKCEQPAGNGFTLNGWMCEVGDPLPPDWRIIVEVSHGEASIELVDPQGAVVDVEDDGLDADGMIQVRVDHARVSDGLDPHFGADF